MMLLMNISTRPTNMEAVYAIKIFPIVTAGIKQYEATLISNEGVSTIWGDNRSRLIEDLRKLYETKHIGKEADTVQ